MAGDSVAGRSGGASAGTATCAVMMESTPASIAARKGTSSTRSSLSRSAVITARLMCVSVDVSPWPGKCFAEVSTKSRLSECAPSMKAFT